MAADPRHAGVAGVFNPLQGVLSTIAQRASVEAELGVFFPPD